MSNKMALDALQLAYIAMQHMGNVLNNIDAVDEEEDAQHDAAFEAVRAAIAALQAEPQGWMPIETAPKDGTRILVCNKANYVYPARWQGVESGKPADWPHGWRDDVMFVAADGIVSWMQLPATPPKD